MGIPNGDTDPIEDREAINFLPASFVPLLTKRYAREIKRLRLVASASQKITLVSAQQAGLGRLLRGNAFYKTMSDAVYATK